VRRKRVRINLADERINVVISGEAARNALGRLYEAIEDSQCTVHKRGLAAVEMFLELFGEEVTEKLLIYCENEPEKSARKFGRMIKRVLFPLAVKQRRYEDRQGVRKYI
jgi:hypothetical protein